VAALSGYTTQDVARMIGVSSGRLRAYLRAGVLSPEKGERGELRFSFQDLLLLRKAEGLVSSRIPPHRVRRALQKLRAQLPESRPLTGVNLGSEGSSVVVQEGNTRWQVESGQVLLSFDRPPPVGAAVDAARAAARHRRR
jgi:DNA-binding transcriptional MerR regulator